MNKFELGSGTAKGGFANEKDICTKFDNWKKDDEAQIWLKIMGYKIEHINSVQAIQIPNRIKKSDIKKFQISDEDYEDLMRFKKSDAQIRIMISIRNILKIENLSLKKANSDADYNQIDKRSADSYQEIWGFDDEILLGLKLFTGEVNPKLHPSLIRKRKLRDKRRMFLDELPDDLSKKIVKFFEDNKILVVNDILKGRGGLSANWMLVTRLDRKNNTTTWIFKDINTTMNFFATGCIEISDRGSLHIGRITMQRKGGTPDPTKLQFKIKPCQLFELRE